MKKNVILASTIGAVVGAIASFIVTRCYYEKKINDEVSKEIESYKNAVHAVIDKHANQDKADEVYTAEPEKNESETENTGNDVPDVIKYARLLAERQKSDYSKFSASIKETEDFDNKDSDEPARVVDYMEFEEDQNYDTMCIYYYADGVYANDDDEIVEDIEKFLGPTPSKHLGELSGDEDVVYFVNDKTQMYYELYRSEKNYFGDVAVEVDQNE